MSQCNNFFELLRLGSGSSAEMLKARITFRCSPDSFRELGGAPGRKPWAKNGPEELQQIHRSQPPNIRCRLSYPAAGAWFLNPVGLHTGKPLGLSQELLLKRERAEVLDRTNWQQSPAGHCLRNLYYRIFVAAPALRAATPPCRRGP